MREKWEKPHAVFAMLLKVNNAGKVKLNKKLETSNTLHLLFKAETVLNVFEFERSTGSNVGGN